MIYQSYTDSLLFAHVAIHTIASDLGAVVVGSDSPMLHIVHMALIIQESAEKSSTFLNFFLASGRTETRSQLRQ